jgi:DNA primase
MAQQKWLEDIIASCCLTPEVEDYFLGRGGKEETLQAEGITTWQSTREAIPNTEFQQRYGPRGEKLNGMLICPVRSPKGILIGFEGRSIQRKYITDYRLPEEKWNPFFLGMTAAMAKVWAGGDVWITEGLFDKCPLEWAVPTTDAVLATVRAALSDKHVEFLTRFCQGTVHMVYDRDETGRKATTGWFDETGKRRLGALEKLRRAGVKCVDVSYSGGKDPGVIWDKGGAEAVRAIFRP